ncbi:MAG: alpha/beta hydrolase family protein [Bacteroidaceae bacterium]
MKRILILLYLAVTFTGKIHAENIPVTIQGDHGKLSAIIQKPSKVTCQKIPLVIICHGFTADKEGALLHTLADSLQAHGIASLRFDFNGHGQSEGSFEDMTVPNEIEDAKRVVSYAQCLPWAGPIILAGHSQGGVVAAMATALLGKRTVAGRILLAPAAVLRDDALRGNTFGAQYDPQNPPQTIELWGGRKLGGNFIRTAISLPIYETARQYKGEQLVIHGECDRIVPYTYGERFHQESKKSRFILLEKADHGFSGMESQVARLCTDFVEKLCH